MIDINIYRDRIGRFYFRRNRGKCSVNIFHVRPRLSVKKPFQNVITFVLLLTVVSEFSILFGDKLQAQSTVVPEIMLFRHFSTMHRLSMFMDNDQIGQNQIFKLNPNFWARYVN